MDKAMPEILVVEDDLALSTGLCFELDEGGCLTVAAYNCQKARRLLKSTRFDLVLLDVNLPDGSGFDLCREIKESRPGLPVILLILSGALAGFIPSEGTGALLTGAGVLIFLLSHAWKLRQDREQAGFANEICDTIDALMEGRKPENYEPYEDSRLSKVQGKLVAYSDAVQEGIRQVEEQRQTIQELVSDISHQVKTPIANIRMFADIVQGHRLPQEKQDEFLKTMT